MLLAFIIWSQFISRKNRMLSPSKFKNLISEKFIGILSPIVHYKSILKKTTIIILIMCSFLFFSSFITANKPKGSAITLRMIENTKRIECMTYEMKKTERIKGKLLVQKSSIKFNRAPFKVYIEQLYPKKGIEVLYIQNKNKNKAQINPNGFPWFNINLHQIGRAHV